MSLGNFICKAVFNYNVFLTLLIVFKTIASLSVPCDKSRFFFNSSWGIITDGPADSNYTYDSHCEWLIKAPSKEFITLTFQTMRTECSYDYLFVYDGDTYESPLLGSFSGRTEPQQITAKSGSMLILLYSDTNYVLDGFKAEFSVTKCPKNCSDHGICIGHLCNCDNEWSGMDCSFKVCPDNCGSVYGRGLCINNYCQCSEGYSGQACDLHKYDLTGNSWHQLSNSEYGLSERAAHSAIYVKETDSFYVFGGYNLNHILGDLWVYNFNKSIWEDQFGNNLVNLSKLTKYSERNKDEQGLFSSKRDAEWNRNYKNLKDNLNFRNYNNSTLFHTSSPYEFFNFEQYEERKKVSKNFNYLFESKINPTYGSKKSNEKTKSNIPSPRYGHAASRYPEGFVIFGGKLKNGSLSNELWFFNVTSQQWSLRARFSDVLPPKLTRHTITLVRNDSLYLFGGSMIGGEFSSNIYSITLNHDIKQEQWKIIQPHGGKNLDLRLVAHTTVYCSQMDSLIVYGGITAGLARLSKLSDKMFIYKISSRFWSEVYYSRSNLPSSYIPRERAFHTSVIVGNYFVVFGGYTHRHNKEEICYDNEMYIYHLGCHTWVSREVLGYSGKAQKRHRQPGVFAHAADIRGHNTLLIVGGYHGNVNGDLWAFVFPQTLAPREEQVLDYEQTCNRYRTLQGCTSNPECGWCSADEACYGRTLGVNCTTNLQTTSCPGLCPALRNCHSCTILGKSNFNNKIFSIVQKLKLGQCAWCVQNVKCHHLDDNYGVCGAKEDNLMQIPGWWGPQGTEITLADECRIKDIRPGLTYINYKNINDLSQPDSVSILNTTNIDIDASVRNSRFEILASGETLISRFIGFLRIPSEWTNSKEILKMCTSYSHSILRLSHNYTYSSLKVVGNISAESTVCKVAYWRPGSPVILHPGRYLVEFESKKHINFKSNFYQQSKMALMHYKNEESAKVFTFEYLEPYKNGSCGIYTNCLHCLTDSLCGWCDLSKKCLRKNLNEVEYCRNEKKEWKYLTLRPSLCNNCSNYISCEKCVSSSLCEWWIEEARCLRRGSRSFTIKALAQCPTPCHLRNNCSECLDKKGRCVWCESTQECFSFSVYTSEYQFGLCREWVDQNQFLWRQSQVSKKNDLALENQKCKNCSRHLSCSECLKTLSCGWCYDVQKPSAGVCVHGNFHNPTFGNCSNIIGKIYNKSLKVNETSWSYSECPDVDECKLKLDDCHFNAICINTYESYKCICKKGFTGDGHRNCTKTCFNQCIHGKCSMAPNYRCICDLGWTGEDCNIDCGCNYHSTCNYKVGVCDKCQYSTSGKYCQYCGIGSYLNHTAEPKCQKCNCNLHENPALGFCDSKTGICFCKHNTEGDQCEKCKKGFFGNPINGGHCYHQCDSRAFITMVESQGLGSYRSTMNPWEARLSTRVLKECFWVLNTTQLKKTSYPSLIQLNIEGNISVSCLESGVTVYEGTPNLISESHQNHVLGTFCQRDDKTTLTVEAKPGILTVLYKQVKESENFNATFSIFACPENCPPPHICVGKECRCKDGWVGPNCSLPVCYNNCSSDMSQGVCNSVYGQCNCRPGYGSIDCSIKINDHQIIFTELFNSVKLSDTFDHLKKIMPRFGHSLLADRRGSLWMFGGYSPSYGPLNDIRLFDTKNNTWLQVTVDSTRGALMPQGRYFHAADIVNSRREIYVYGGIGITRQNKTLNDFWKFSIKHQRWIYLNVTPAPPPAAGHTLTFMKDDEVEKLFLIGGFSTRHGFSSKIWAYDISKNDWISLKTSGKGPVEIFGHTTVYHISTKSFYVYGGYLLSESNKQRIYSNQLYSLHFQSLKWFLLPTFEEYNPAALKFPQPRFLHSAITTGDYMLVFGGKSFQKNSTLPYSDLLIAYFYSCNQWIPLLSKETPAVGAFPPMTYAQAMTFDLETATVYIVGGFDNIIHSGVTRINLPLDLCNLWKGKEKCRLFLGCSFCSVVTSENNLFNHCYSSIKSFKESCNYYNGTLITNNGVVCDYKWFQHRNCENFKTCAHCLAKWPINVNEKPVCKWCNNCSRGRCLPFNYTCKEDEKCDVIINIDQCDSPTCTTECTKHSVSNTSLLEEKVLNSSEYCSQFDNCSICLTSKCRWSTNLKLCFAPDFQPLFCAGSVCGLVLNEENQDQCPEPCSNYIQCATCLKNINCGWCSINARNRLGEGVCTLGTFDHPLTQNGSKSSCAEVIDVTNFKTSYDLIKWNYAFCPEENECTNNHHTCRSLSEVCFDLPQGFRCDCEVGYEFFEDECKPVCTQGCVQGKCIKPNTCQCDFGYVGANCSFQCQCNGHSDCIGPNKLNQCIKCHNNTIGAQCERCKPLFVGDPTNNGKCISCFEYCHGHSNICISDSNKQFFTKKSVKELLPLLEEGPVSNALCVLCSNKTSGRKCDACLEGYFRGTEDLRQRCKPCECQGHGDRCDPVTGEKCNCGNNTESDCQTNTSKNSNQQCWMLQCSKCKETFSGTPTKGHQCYKQMIAEQKFCFDAKLLEECKLKSKPLYPGQSVFFQIQPRFVNVDIRLYVDVMQGSLDLYMSLLDDSLVVKTNSSSGHHILEWDAKYQRQFIWINEVLDVQIGKSNFTRKKIHIPGNWSLLDFSSEIHFGLKTSAQGLSTYITFSKYYKFLQVKNVRNRLVIMLRRSTFDLANAKFYIGLIANTNGNAVAPTHGVLFFRQDQLHIDLFVFFSVFFSCFFLFLSASLIVWRAKQTANIRRAERMQAVEMIHLRKRPYSTITLILDDDNFSNEHMQSTRMERNFYLLNQNTGVPPVAIEPLNGDMAVIATFFVKLPGGRKTPVQLSLASSLITMSRSSYFSDGNDNRTKSSGDLGFT